MKLRFKNNLSLSVSAVYAVLHYIFEAVMNLQRSNSESEKEKESWLPAKFNSESGFVSANTSEPSSKVSSSPCPSTTTESTSWYSIDDSVSDLLPDAETLRHLKRTKTLNYSQYRYFRTILKERKAADLQAEEKEKMDLLELQRCEYNAKNLSLDVELLMLQGKRKHLKKHK